MQVGVIVDFSPDQCLVLLKTTHYVLHSKAEFPNNIFDSPLALIFAE